MAYTEMPINEIPELDLSYDNRIGNRLVQGSSALIRYGGSLKLCLQSLNPIPTLLLHS